MSIVYRSKAPTRIYFGGGGTDMSPYTEEFGGCVLSAAINRYVYGTLLKRSDKRIHLTSADYKKSLLFEDIEDLTFDGDLDLMKAVAKVMQPDYGFMFFLRSDVPPNTGLGSSATAAVSTIGLFNYANGSKTKTLYDVAELAYYIEDHELKNVGGRQDQYAAAFGGLSLIEFKGKDFVQVSPVRLGRGTINELEKHLVLAFVGPRPPSGPILDSQQKSYSKKEKIKCLHHLKSNTHGMHQALTEGAFEKFGKLINDSWETKIKLNPNITTSKIENLRQIALQNGAIGCRLMGAGMGGHMICYCYPNKEQVVSKSLEENGARTIDFSFDWNGLQTWEVDSSNIERELEVF